MAGEWINARLGDVIELKRGYDLPSLQRKSGTVPIVSSSGVSGTHSEAMATGPGVVTGRYGTIGQVHYIKEAFWPLNTTLYVRDFKGSDPRFVAYFLNTLDFFAYSDKAAVPGVNRNDLHLAKVVWPPRREQQAIAEVLGALDDKIDVNRRMAETLEALARALFKSWFVDFDPVRAKAEGRPTGLPDELSDLFPAAFSGDGVPQGWEERGIHQFVQIVYGAPFASAQFNTVGTGLPLIRVRDLASHQPTTFTDEVHRNGHIIEPGDIVVGMDGEFRCHVWQGPKSYLNQRVCHLEPLRGSPTSYIILSIEEPLARFEAGAVGTTVIHLGKKDLDTINFVWPGEAVLMAFGATCDPLFARIVKCAEQRRALGALRDTLLPRLISGELRIQDAEHAIAVA